MSRILFALLCALRLCFGADSLFDDPVVARSKIFQIRESDVQEAYVAQKAAAAAFGQTPAPQLENQLKRQILEKLIANRVLLAHAKPIDKEAGRKLAARMIKESREKAGTEAAYRRRLLAVGSSPEKYEAELLEQAIVQAVIDRELRDKVVVADSEVRKFYEANSSGFTDPEKIRVGHILFATRKIPSGDLLSAEQRQIKRAAAQNALARARAGEDFGKLIQELSEDPEKVKNKGELSFSRGAGTVPPEFESAAVSLEPGKISELVTTVFGYHIIKVIEKIPSGVAPLEKVADGIRERLQRQEVQKELPDYIKKLRTEAGVEVITK